MSKGSKQRPRQVSRKQYERNWDAAFVAYNPYASQADHDRAVIELLNASMYETKSYGIKK